MPKKKQALPTPKAKLYTEDAALLVPIFQKEPFITFQELQDKYGDILTDQQIYRGLLGTFAPYVSERREEAFQEQLLQAKQAALQLEIISHPVGGSLTMPETEVRSLARTSFNSMLDGMPAGMACYITCAVNAMYAGDVSDLKNEPLSERMLLSSANQGPLEKYSMQTDSIFRNLPKLLPEEENEVYVGKSAGKNVSTIVTMDFPKTIALDGGGSLTNFDKAILNGVSSLLIAGTIYFTVPMLYRAMIGSENPSMREEAVQTIRDPTGIYAALHHHAGLHRGGCRPLHQRGAEFAEPDALAISLADEPDERCAQRAGGRGVLSHRHAAAVPVRIQQAANFSCGYGPFERAFRRGLSAGRGKPEQHPRHHCAEELPADPH